MDNPEKAATKGTQDDDKQNKSTAQYMLDTTIHKQTQVTYIRHESSYKQLVVKTNRTSFLCGNSKETTQTNMWSDSMHK